MRDTTNRYPVISPELIALHSTDIEQPQISGSDYYWIEYRATSNGRAFLVHRDAQSSYRDVSAPEHNVRTTVNEYGGGAYCVYDNQIWYVNSIDQCIYYAFNGSKPVRLTPLTNVDTRFAELVYDKSRQRIIAICEQHVDGKETTSIISINTHDGSVSTMHSGHDFYASPALNSDDNKLAFIAWNFPNMPWDCTTLYVCDLDNHGNISTTYTIPGSERASFCQPQWCYSDRLYYISDQTGWWNIYTYSPLDGKTENISPISNDFCDAQWRLGVKSYAVVSRDKLLCCYVSNGNWKLTFLDVATGELEPCLSEYTSTLDLTSSKNGALVICASQSAPKQLVYFDYAPRQVHIIKESNNYQLNPEKLSKPIPITFPTDNNEQAHGLLYLPNNPKSREKPPLIIHVHGGPTFLFRNQLDLRVQFWTTQGYAVLGLNYRGSTGYGRSFRQKINRQWGISEVSDCIYAAQYCQRENYTHPTSVFLVGESAGGYTVLRSLIMANIFTAGVCSYGVCDLEHIMKTPHKFESCYGHSLIAPYPDDIDSYRELSPFNHVDQIDSPILFFQGLNDKIVPPEQTNRMVEKLHKKGNYVEYYAYENEGHGFRGSYAIQHSLQKQQEFFNMLI